MDTMTRMQAFIAVVDAGGFSAAARETGRSKALMSKYVSELEEELGARLLNRTTRQISLTESGEAAYEEAQEVLRRVGRLRETIEAANAAPRGRLKVSAPRAEGDGDLGRAIMDFLAAYPDIRMELQLEERFVDLVEEGYDVAIRIASLADSSMIARKLSDFCLATYCAPQILAAHGRPEHPSDLTGLPCIVDTNVRSPLNWTYRVESEKISVPVKGRIEVNSPTAAVSAALAGLGFGRGPWPLVRRHVEAGTLVTVLGDYEPDDLGIYAIYPHRERMPAKLRVFIDHLVAWYESSRKAGRAG
jgi:DNA-binding transcriptional LysR family regulator